MIKHIVCFKLKENADKEKTKEVLLSMKGNVDEIVDIFVGVDFLGSHRSYDVVLEVVLKDKAYLHCYQNNEYHVNVVKKYMSEVVETSVAIDCEI